MALVAKRTLMSLYADTGVHSHQALIVLAEKGVMNVEIFSIEQSGTAREELNLCNPYGTVPTLIDRELTLYETRIIVEYLEERYPHPPLFPVGPGARAETRKMLHRIETDWYSLFAQIEKDPHAEAVKASLLSSLVQLDPIFGDKPYFLSEEFSLLDCSLAPLLWRLPTHGIVIPQTAKALSAYQDRLFNRPCFQQSLQMIERQGRAA